MAQTADELEADVVHTRDDISGALDEVGDRISPKQMVKGGTHRLSQWVHSARDGIMGSVSDVDVPAGPGGDSVGDGQVEGRDGSASVAGQSNGNPLAAGMIAFGVGLLVGSILRPTKVEQQGLSAIADKAEPAIDAAMQAASELGHGVQESTRQAASGISGVFADAGEAIVHKADDSISEVVESVRGAPEGEKDEAVPEQPSAT